MVPCEWTGLVFQAHRLSVSLNSRLESNKEEEEGPGRWAIAERWFSAGHLWAVKPSIYTSSILEVIGESGSCGFVWEWECRGTSLIRNTPPVGPFSSPMPRDLW